MAGVRPSKVQKHGFGTPNDLFLLPYQDRDTKTRFWVHFGRFGSILTHFDPPGPSGPSGQLLSELDLRVSRCPVYRASRDPRYSKWSILTYFGQNGRFWSFLGPFWSILLPFQDRANLLVVSLLKSCHFVMHFRGFWTRVWPKMTLF